MPDGVTPNEVTPVFGMSLEQSLMTRGPLPGISTESLQAAKPGGKR